MLDRMRELYTAARDPGVVAPAHVERRIHGQLLAGLGQLLFAAENQSGHDQRLRARPALHQTTVHQHLIEAHLFGIGNKGVSDHCACMKPIYLHLGGALALSFTIAAVRVPAPDLTPVPTPSPTPEPVQTTPPPLRPRRQPRTGSTNRAHRGIELSRRMSGAKRCMDRAAARCCSRSNAIAVRGASHCCAVRAASSTSMTIRTETVDRTLAATPAGSGSQQVMATLAASDPLLDAMAVTRGRSAVETTGLSTLYLPPWAEVTRAIRIPPLIESLAPPLRQVRRLRARKRPGFDPEPETPILTWDNFFSRVVLSLLKTQYIHKISGETRSWDPGDTAVLSSLARKEVIPMSHGSAERSASFARGTIGRQHPIETS